MPTIWEKFANENKFTYEEFTKEILVTTMALMQSEMQKNSSTKMTVTTDNLQLTCQIITTDEKKANEQIH